MGTADRALVEAFVRDMAVDPGEDTARAYLADDAVVTANGREMTAREFYASVSESRPYEFVDVSYDHVVVEGDVVAVWATGRCELTGSIYGVEGVDEELALSEAVFCRVEDGDIRRAHILTDRVVFYEQLGLLSEDPHNERVRDQYYAILGRVLRHDLRNRLGVVRAAAEALADGADPAVTSERILAAVDDLMDTAEKARTLQQRAIDVDVDPGPVDVAGVVEPLVVAHDDPPAVRCRLEATDAPSVTTDDRLLEVIVRELVENAVDHAGEVAVSVTPADAEGYDVVVTVADDGPGVPEEELAPLRAGEETALLHGSGIGLWIVEWGATRLHGDVAFETGPGGTRVRLYLPDMARP
jgi:signal transduction histidine kinase